MLNYACWVSEIKQTSSRNNHKFYTRGNSHIYMLLLNLNDICLVPFHLFFYLFIICVLLLDGECDLFELEFDSCLLLVSKEDS